MLKGVIFDMDGVLIDSHPIHRHAWRKFLATVGKTIQNKQLDFILEGRRREDILRYFLGDLPEAMMAEYGERKDYFFDENFSHIKPIPGVLSLLDTLEGADIKLGIATSASAFRTRKTLQLLGMEARFLTVITGDDVLAGKPDPAVYRKVSERMNLDADSLLVLEDAPCGVQAAKSAGMCCIGVSSNGRAEALRQAGADLVIPNFVGLQIDELRRLWATITAGRV
jgi:HAD superfamily hydrolase (TIGR01509 family)